jgi:hypothetical protein
MIVFSQGCFYAPASATFQLVDGETHEPLKDVNGRRRSDVAVIDMIFGRTLIFGGKPGTYSLPTTDENGMVFAKGLTGDLLHLFTFERQGYYAAHVVREAENGRVTVELPPSDAHHEFRGRELKIINHVFVVPMYRSSLPVATYEPEWVEVNDTPHELVSRAATVVQAEWARSGVSWNSKGFEVRSYRNQYGDYRVLFLKPKAGNRYQVELVGITPPDETTLYVSTDICPMTPSGPDVSKIPEWNERSGHAWPRP